jgi:uncharacterized protein (DUF305 family)
MGAAIVADFHRAEGREVSNLVRTHAPWIALGLGCLALGAAAQGGHRMPGQGGAADPASAAYMAASERMHRDMAIEFTGNPDVDFARAMIPHHRGAIDMARAVLDHGQDPEIRALAEGIIAAQESEIAVLRAWLEERGESAE